MGRSESVHKKDFTMDVLLGSFQNVFFGVAIFLICKWTGASEKEQLF